MRRRPAGFAAVCALTVAAAAAPRAQAPQGLETFDAVWTIVRDTHFDKTFNGVDWDAVRSELRPRAEGAKTTAELRSVLRDMLGRLGQSHFNIIPSGTETAPGSLQAGSAEPGFDFRLVENELLVRSVAPGGAAASAGVRPGWQLTAIGASRVADLLRPLAETSDDRVRQLEAWRAATARLRGAEGTRVDVAFADGHGKPVQLSLERRAEAGEPVTVGALPTMFVRVESRRVPTPSGAQAGLIAFNVWMASVDAQFQKAMDQLRDGDGIIIDLRGNPGGLAAMLMGISGHFVGERKPLGVMKMRSNADLQFFANPRLVNARGERVPVYAGPVAILVDGMSGSASECFTGGMQSIGRARVFGQTTMGHALPALFDRLPNGDVLIHAYGDFITADGTRLEGRGVVPDESVPLRRADLLADRDRTLEAALAWIDSQKVSRKP